MTNAEARFNKPLRPRKPEGSLGRTAQDVHLDSHTAPELCHLFFSSLLLYVHEARWPIRDGDRVGRGRQSEGSTAETARRRPERQWTAARSVKAVSPRHCPATCALRNCCFNCCAWTVTKTISVALLLTNNLDNSKQKRSNLLSPAPPPYS